jgi:hypothetical protein
LKRNQEIKIRLTRDELESLTKKVRRSGYSREAFCRKVLSDVELKEAPPAEYYDMIRELRRVGSNINQVLKKANAAGLLDVPMLRKALDGYKKTEKMLWDTFRPEGE